MTLQTKEEKDAAFDRLMARLRSLKAVDMAEVVSLLSTLSEDGKAATEQLQQLAEEAEPRLRYRVDFSGLYEILAPNIDLLDYYIDTLSRSKEYGFLKEVEDDFQLLEEELNRKERTLLDAENESVGRLTDRIEKTSAFDKLSKRALKIDDVTYVNRQGSFLERPLIRIRVAQEEYSALKRLDSQEELPKSWQQLCEECDVPAAFSSSRVYRHEVFERILPHNPRLYTQAILYELIHSLDNYGLSQETIAHLSDHDLVIDAADQQNDLISLIDEEERFSGSLDIEKVRIEMVQKDVYVWTISHLSGVEEEYKSLRGAKPEDFYPLFKKHILNENAKVHDLYFRHNGRLARWVH